jgi:tetratricopeptide (TPR) repeat protein
MLFILLFYGKLYSQNDYITNSVKTPRNSTVSDTWIKQELTPKGIIDYNTDFDTSYPYATRISSASRRYNCHAYAWHITENGWDYVWIGYETETAEDIYWEDGSYDEVSEACATKVRYSGNHSAITTTTPNVYISKWGQWPLVMHNKNDVPPGYGTPYKFYAKAIEVNSGAELISALNAAQSCCRKVHILGSANFTVSTLVTVPSCVTLEIHSGANVTFAGGMVVNGSLSTNGATLNFASGTVLTSYGKLDCNNTIFTGSNWGGIVLNGSGSNGSMFHSCTISQVNNLGGFALSFNNNSSSTVSYCTISNLSSYGTSAIYASNSNIKVYKNKIQNNSIGVRGINNTNIRFGSILQLSCNSGNNTITGNVSGGIEAHYATYFDLSILVPEYSHMNNISGNIGFNAIATNSSQMDARVNYWDGNPAPGISFDGTSYIDAGSVSACTPPLPSRIGMIEEDSSNVAIPQLKKVAYNTISSDIAEELKRARGLAYSEKFNEAMDIYKSILLTNKGNAYTTQTLNSILYIYRITQDKGLLEYLRVYSRGEANPFIKMAYGNALIAGGYVEEALIEYEEIAKNNPRSIHAIQALIQQSYIYYFYKNDIKKANEILVGMEKIAEKDDIDVKQLKAVITNGIDTYKRSEGFVDNNDEEKETELKVADYSLSNYPNPFNPSTIIKYQLPEASQVSLKVYDVMGKEVTTLVNSYQDKGSYDITFNANGLSSGIYFYKLNVNGKQLINKMLLMK